MITTPSLPDKCVTVDCKFDGKKFIVNWESLAASIEECLNAEPNFIPHFGSTHLTDMQKFHVALERVVNYGKAKSNTKVYNDLTVDREELVHFYLKYITLLCQMLTCLDSFKKFSPKDKVSFRWNFSNLKKFLVFIIQKFLAWI